MLKAASKPVTLLTMFMSIPLFLSFNIKYQWFPEGAAYALLYFWGLLSVLVVPALLLLEIILLIWIRPTSTQAGELKSSLHWNLLGIAVAVVAEVIFIAARNSQP